MNVSVACRDEKQLHKLLQVLLDVAQAEIISQRVVPLVVETYRYKERQYYLACKGRNLSEAITMGVPKAKAQKYIALLKAEKYTGGKVTWTLNSIHIQRRAVDMIPQRKTDGKWIAIWNQKDPETQIIIKTMQKYGFEPGANWSNSPDSPHFQIKCTLGTTFSKKNNTSYVTTALQKQLNKKLNIHLVVDGDWGELTTAAVNKFRKKQGYKVMNGKLGAAALKALFK